MHYTFAISIPRMTGLEKGVARQSSVKIPNNCGLNVLLLAITFERVVVEQRLEIK